MSSIFFLILFVFPGIIYKVIVKRCVPKPIQKESAYEELTKASVFSIFVLVLNIFAFKETTLGVLNILLGINENNLLTEPDLPLITGYFLKTLVSTIIVAGVYRFLVMPVGLNLLNLYRAIRGLSLESKGKTAWDTITEVSKTEKTPAGHFLANLYNKMKKSDDKEEQPRVVSIIKGGKIISSGCLTSFFNSAMTWKDIKLMNAEDVTERLAGDPNLFNEYFDYYLLNDDIIIRFYDTDKYYADLDKRLKEWREEKGE